jgi:hypothetical protein
VQGRQVVEHRSPPGLEHRFDGGEDPLVERDAVGQRSRDLHLPAPGGEGGEGIAPDERPPAPALAVLDRFQEEAGLVPHDAGEGRHGGREVAEQVPPDRDHRVGAGELPEGRPVRPEGHPKFR